MKKKIAIIVGTRPEIIRFSPIIQYLEKNKDVNYSLIHTGQHYSKEMSEIFFEELGLPAPAINLSIDSFNPCRQLAEIINKTGQYILNDKPDVVCVWGDTNSSLGAAIATNKTKTKLCHLESGCRSHDFRMAEEYNRILIDHLSDLLFPLSTNDMNNLLEEKVHGKSFFLGDPLYDVFLQNQLKVKSLHDEVTYGNSSPSILMTLHRAENVDDKKTLEKILHAVRRIKNGNVIFPLHPRTEKMIKEFGLAELLNDPHTKVIPPLGYLELLTHLNRCDVVITDSGGLQKEAFFARKYCITLRKSTEWLDTVRLGVNTIIDPEEDNLDMLPYAIKNHKKIGKLFSQMQEKPYGDGQASDKIVETIINAIR